MMYPVATLYVGDLHCAANQDDLERAFKCFPGYIAAKLCRDHVSGNSLCYAYVNFQTQPQAESAMRAMNHVELMGKPMRIMWIKRDPYSRKTGVGNLFVKNLELLVSAADLERVFSQFGSVLSCKVVYDKFNGRSMRFGFVQMCSEKAAQKAILALHDSNSTCLSKSLYVAKFVKKGSEKKNLYIKNLEGSITSKDLRDKFAQFGQVASAIVMEDKLGNSKGFGFVSFDQIQDAESALSAMNGSTWGSKVIYVGVAQKKAERGSLLKQQFAAKGKEEEQLKIRAGGKKWYGLYVGNLEESVSSEDLRQLFESCGNVIFTKVALDLNKHSRGFGFVYFSTAKGVRSALTMDGMSIVKGKPIKVKRAYPKRISYNKNAATAAPGSTVPSHAATAAPVQPFACPVYPDMMKGMYNAEPVILPNLWTSEIPLVPAYNYDPSAAPAAYHFGPSMHGIQPLNTPVNGWEMGPSQRALSLAPLTGACSNSGKKGVARAKTEDVIKPRRMVFKFQEKGAACAERSNISPMKRAAVA